MLSPAEIYAKGIREHLRHYFAAWLPNEKLELGDVGHLEGDFFRKTTNLEKLGISFDEIPDTDPTPIDIVSQEGISFNLKLAGETNDEIPGIPKAKAGFSLNFKNTGGYVFQAAESYEPVIDDIEKLKKQILKALKNGEWDKNWAAIVKIVNVPYASYIISQSSNSEIVYSTDVDLKKGIIDIGNAGINLSLRKQSGVFIKLIGAKNISPFFQLVTLKRKLGIGPIEPVLTSMKIGQPISEPDYLKSITPQIVRENKEVEDSLYLDVISYNE